MWFSTIQIEINSSIYHSQVWTKLHIKTLWTLPCPKCANNAQHNGSLFQHHVRKNSQRFQLFTEAEPWHQRCNWRLHAGLSVGAFGRQCCQHRRIFTWHSCTALLKKESSSRFCRSPFRSNASLIFPRKTLWVEETETSLVIFTARRRNGSHLCPHLSDKQVNWYWLLYCICGCKQSRPVYWSDCGITEVNLRTEMWFSWM